MAACYTADSILTERKLTRMKTNSFVRTIAMLAAIALAVPAFAKPFTKTINIAQTAKVGKSELKAGEYRLQIEGNKATVQKGKDVVAESEGRWEDRSTKANYDSVLISETGQVKEVRFAGQTRVFVFNEEWGDTNLRSLQDSRGRLHSIAASFLVFLAAELLKWQDPAFAASAVLCPLLSLSSKRSSIYEVAAPTL